MNKKIIFLCACIFSLAAGSVVTLAAENKTRINSTKLKIVSDYEEGTNLTESDFTITPEGEGYFVEEITQENIPANDIWCRHDSPILLIRVSAKEGYYFVSSSKSSVRITGEKGTIESVKRDSGQESLNIKILLNPLSTHIGNPYRLSWNSLSIGDWEDGYKNDTYEVRLYRDGKSIKTIKLSGSSCNFSEYMTKAAEYYFAVRGVNDNEDGYRSDWVYSDSTTILEENLETIKGQVNNTAELDNKTTEGWKEPGVPNIAESQWILDATGWWYRHADQTYSTSKWEQIGGKWYYFNEQGYLLVNTTTPDGYKVDGNGVWIEEAAN